MGSEVTTAPSVTEAEDPEAARRAIASCLKPFVLGLPPDYSEALVLTSFEGLSQKEAARRLGLSDSGEVSRPSLACSGRVLSLMHNRLMAIPVTWLVLRSAGYLTAVNSSETSEAG